MIHYCTTPEWLKLNSYYMKYWSIDEYMEQLKLSYITMMEYISAIQKEELLIHITWINLKSITLSEKSQTLTYYIISFKWSPRNDKTHVKKHFIGCLSWEWDTGYKGAWELSEWRFSARSPSWFFFWGFRTSPGIRISAGTLGRGLPTQFEKPHFLWL